MGPFLATDSPLARDHIKKLIERLRVHSNLNTAGIELERRLKLRSVYFSGVFIEESLEVRRMTNRQFAEFSVRENGEEGFCERWVHKRVQRGAGVEACRKKRVAERVIPGEEEAVRSSDSLEKGKHTVARHHCESAAYL